MKFIEIVMPRNTDISGLPDNVLINLDGILEVHVRTLMSREEDFRGYEYGLFIMHQSREMRFHGTRSECERTYKELCELLESHTISHAEGIVGKLVFPSEKPPF